MANLLIIFKNYNVDILSETINFLRKFKKKFQNLTGDKNPQEDFPKLCEMIDYFH